MIATPTAPPRNVPFGLATLDLDGRLANPTRHVEDFNAICTGGSGSVGNPYRVDAVAYANLPAGSRLTARTGENYACTNGAGLGLPANRHDVDINGNGATIANAGTGRAQAMFSVGNYDAAGNPVNGDNDQNYRNRIYGWTIDGGPFGVTYGLRMMSSHMSYYADLEFRNYVVGTINRGGVQVTYERCKYNLVDASWTQHFVPTNGLVITGAPYSGGAYPPSAIVSRGCNYRLHYGDGVRALLGFGIHLEHGASEKNGTTATGRVVDYEYAPGVANADGSGGGGAGVYAAAGQVGVNAGVTMTNFNCEENALYPASSGFRTGVVVAAGAYGTRVRDCNSFSGMTIIENGAENTLVDGGIAPVIADGQGIVVIGRAPAAVTRGPNVRKLVLLNTPVGFSDWIQEMEISGWLMKDTYNGGGAATYAMLCHRDVIGSNPDNGANWFKYAVFQDAVANTRIGGSTVTINVEDRQVLAFDATYKVAVKDVVTGQNGGLLYAENGALKFKGNGGAGTATVIAPA